MAKHPSIPEELLKLMNPQGNQLGPATFPTLGQPGQAGLAEFNAPPPQAGTPPPLSLNIGVPSLSDPTAPTQDFSGTGGGGFFSSLREGSIFRSSGPAPSVIAAQERGEVSAPDRNFPEVPLATPSDFSATAAAPSIPAPESITAPTAPTTGGTITRDETGEVFNLQEPTGALADFEARIAAANPQINPSDVSAASAARGRPINVSTSEVAVARRQESQREQQSADDLAVAEFSRGLTLDGGTIADREEKIAEFREGLSEDREDARSPEKIESDRLSVEAQELEVERKKQVVDAGRKPDATNFEKFQSDLELSGLSDKAKEAALFKKFGLDPFDFQDDGGDADSTGDTTSDAGSTPATSTPTVRTQAEYDALPSGAQYIDSKGNKATKK